MTEKVKLIELFVRSNGTAALFIDGTLFPWMVSWDITVESGSEDQVGGMSLFIPSDAVIVKLEESPTPAEEVEPERVGDPEWEVGARFAISHEEPPSYVTSFSLVDFSNNVPFVRDKKNPNMWKLIGDNATVSWAWPDFVETYFSEDAQVTGHETI